MSGVSVVICTHQPQRRADLAEAIDSVLAQTMPALEIVLVVDHQPVLEARLRTELPGVLVVPNEGPRGASGARNTGAALASGEWLAFLDDDAVAEPEWLAHLTKASKDPAVLGVGGRITPLWSRPRPPWFPDEFAWVVGASYRGLPPDGGIVRNVWTGSMLVSREVFDAVGGFRVGFGKTGGRSAPEDTDFCLRAARAFPGRVWRYEPGALVGHRVPAQRCTVGFFLRRCYAEGRGKVELARLLSGAEGMSSELSHARTLPAAVLREFRAGAVRRGLMIVAGLGAVAAGAVRGLCAPKATHAEVSFRPTRIGEIELSRPLPSIPATEGDRRFGAALLLARWYSEPLALVDIPLTRDATRADVAAAVWPAVRDAVAVRMAAVGARAPDSLPEGGLRLTGPSPFLAERERAVTAGPLVSVVVCTRDRAALLPACLNAVMAQDYPRFEVVVVDNVPSTDAVARLVADLGDRALPVRRIVEPRPGLAWARNRGLSAAHGAYVAFLDDDGRPDRHWLAEIVHGFAIAPNVAGVGGVILPAALDTPAQCWFERFGGHSKGRGFTAEIFDAASHDRQHPLYPLPPFGTGANMAFSKDALTRIGGFDVALGAGTAVHGGEDTAAISDLMLSGATFVYWPAAVMWHHHRDDFAALEAQLRGYGAGLTAFYTRALRDPDNLPVLARLLPSALHDLRGRDSVRTATMGEDYPRALRRAHLRGMLAGPAAYVRSSVTQGNVRRRTR